MQCQVFYRKIISVERYCGVRMGTSLMLMFALFLMSKSICQHSLNKRKKTSLGFIVSKRRTLMLSLFFIIIEWFGLNLSIYLHLVTRVTRCGYDSKWGSAQACEHTVNELTNKLTNKCNLYGVTNKICNRKDNKNVSKTIFEKKNHRTIANNHLVYAFIFSD